MNAPLINAVYGVATAIWSTVSVMHVVNGDAIAATLAVAATVTVAVLGVVYVRGGRR